MSRQNITIIRAVIDGWLSGDSSALELIAEDVVYVSPPSMPGARTYHGHSGVLQWVVDWRQEWSEYELEVERVEEIGDQVITVERNRAIGKRSGVEADMETVSLWTLRDGKVLRWQGFDSEEEARAAAENG
jgi:ketosteroid isomerase-like protein